MKSESSMKRFQNLSFISRLALLQGSGYRKVNWKKLCANVRPVYSSRNNQFIAIMHNDTNHQHVHIVANRIGFDGKTVSDSNNYKRMADFCRQHGRKTST